MRPGIILTTRSEPIPNWVDHIYGPIGITAGCYVGAIRVVKFSQDDKGELMPADMTVNCLLAVGYETAKLRNLEDIPIYNFTSHPDNSVRWNNLYLYLKARAAEIPYSKACWHYTSVINVKSNFLYYFLTLLLHVLPAVLMDFGLLFLHKKPRVLHLYNKIHNGMDLVGYFSMNSWKFSMDNTINLWKNLNDEDKKLFDFDMESLDYESFLKGTVDGIKTYLVKDEDEDVVSTKRRYFVVYLIDRLFRILLLSGLLWCIWRILTDIRDYWL